MNKRLHNPISLKEESDFRNERDVVPAGIRTGLNPQNYFFCFLERWCPATRRRGREFLEFLEFFEFFRVIIPSAPESMTGMEKQKYIMDEIIRSTEFSMGVGFGQGSVPLF